MPEPSMAPVWNECRIRWLGLGTVPLPPELMQYLHIPKANLGIQPEALTKPTVLWILTLELGKEDD